MSKEDNEPLSDKLRTGVWSKPPVKPIRSEETRKRLADLESRRDLERRIGKDIWED
jgi:hypothetical protein